MAFALFSKVPQLSFYAYNKGIQVPPSEVVPFQTVAVNVGGQFDVTRNRFIASQYGLYWFHVRVWSNDSSMADFSMKGTYGMPLTGVLRTQPKGGEDVLSRDDIRWLENRARIYTSSPTTPTGSIYVNAMSVWIGLKIDDLMDPLIAFNVYQNETIMTPNSSLPVPFTNIVLNEGNGWSSSFYKFVSPVTGIYIFSYSTASTKGFQSLFNLVIDNTILYNVEISDTSHPGIVSSSRSVPINITQGQSVWITGNGKQSYGNQYQLPSFKGFLYSPVHGMKVVWSVHTTAAGNCNWNGLNIPFELIHVNVGNAWQSGQSQVVIPMAGIYYISISITAKSSGIDSFVCVNGTRAGTASAIATQLLNDRLTREGAFLFQLRVGDTVSVRDGTNCYTGYTSFSGFFLYPK